MIPLHYLDFFRVGNHKPNFKPFFKLNLKSKFFYLIGSQDAVVPEPDRLAVEGKVVQRAECRPISNNVYLSIKKEALLKPTTEVRKTKHLDKVVNSYKPVANHAFNKMHQVSDDDDNAKSL